MLPGMVCIWSFSSWVEVSITVVGIFLVVNAARTSFVAVFAEGWVVFIVILVVSFSVMLKEVPVGSTIKGVGH